MAEEKSDFDKLKEDLRELGGSIEEPPDSVVQISERPLDLFKFYIRTFIYSDRFSELESISVEGLTIQDLITNDWRDDIATGSWWGRVIAGKLVDHHFAMKGLRLMSLHETEAWKIPEHLMQVGDPKKRELMNKVVEHMDREIESHLVSFHKLHVRNYGPFQGDHEFLFNKQKTFIIGGNGKGKTVLANSLVNLVLDPKIQPTNDTHVEVETFGGRQLLSKYKKLILVNEESLLEIEKDQKEYFTDITENDQWTHIESSSRDIFRSLLYYKPDKIEAHIEQSAPIMEIGEILCHSLSFILAARELLEYNLPLNLPLILDQPYKELDQELKQGLDSYLDRVDSQQVIFVSEPEIRNTKIINYEAAKRRNAWVSVFSI